MTGVRRNIMLGTAGHVDHGKTALVKLLTGCETDTLAEEKQRGLTIDLGFAPCRLRDDRIVGVVDVPGHVDFIRNMVAGAHGIDVVIFVVAADDGIMPQTREHLHILTLMGVEHGLVALTKIDLVEAQRRQQVIEDLRRLLSGTFLAQAPICPLSNISGEGYGDFFDTLNQVTSACGERPSSGLFRVWVEDVFTVRGSGTVITGIPASGAVRAGDAMMLLPSGKSGHVRRMQVYGAEATEALAGECVALNLPEVEHLEVKRGMMLCTPGTLAPVNIAEAELRILESVKGRIKDYLEVNLHIGTAAVLANIAMLERTEMVAGERQMVQLRLTEPLPLLPGDRFALRANVGGEGQGGLITIGGGRILGVSDVRLRRKKSWTLSTLAKRQEALGDATRWCELMLHEADRPLTITDLQMNSFLRADEIDKVAQQLRNDGRVITLPNGTMVLASKVEEVAGKMSAAIEVFHRANPQRAGIDRDELFSLLRANAEICDVAAELLLKARRVERQGLVYARPGWTARLSDPDQRLSDQIAEAFQKAGWAGPSAVELAASLGQPADRVERIMNLLVEKAALVRLDPRVFIHRDAVESARQVVMRLFAHRPIFSTMEFRDALGVSRKYAVPLLDYLDKVRFTVRSGHDRTPGVEARKLLK